MEDSWSCEQAAMGKTQNCKDGHGVRNEDPTSTIARHMHGQLSAEQARYAPSNSNVYKLDAVHSLQLATGG